ncbi:hypothetical protein Pmani_010874 [Petrolisthes manimaculis]|uniref:Transporter n=1 Tax=Petrolisthes manimaculis TaxID=1843537 RepID=A0AAE1Q0V7_9EUCA|nr:hypothetical protein Pmani_010874 [Petrolisthes manimaculis]
MKSTRDPLLERSHGNGTINHRSSNNNNNNTLHPPPPSSSSATSEALSKCLHQMLRENPEFRMTQDDERNDEGDNKTTTTQVTQQQQQQQQMEEEGGESQDQNRETWDNQLQFIMYCLGYAIGFGNVWRFPYLCYKNGGAAFLIPYLTVLLLAGIPIFFLELFLGQYISLGPATLYPKLAPIFSGVGWGMVMIPLMTAIYFNVILAWTFFYTFFSFSSVLPWGHCDNDFNSPECYIKEAGDECKKQSLYYYNQTCLNVSQYCHQAYLDEYNATHCYNPLAPSNIKPVETVLPRMTASEDFFKNRMLGVTGKTWDNMGGMRWELVGCLALTWIIVGACLAKGIRTTGKIVYFTALFPYVVLIILFARGITLDGAYQGLEFYLLRPNMTRLTEISVWNDAAIQIFYSLGICFGCLITLSSYNKFTNNCLRDALVIAFSNCCTSIFIGLVIFSVLGFLAKELGVEVDQVVTSGSGLAFVVYPAALSLLPFSQLWAVLFFMMLLTIGLGSQFTMVETVATALVDQFESFRSHKGKVVVVMCIVIFLMGLSMCLEGGIYMFELFFFFSPGVSVIILGLTQLIGVMGVFGFRNIMTALKEMQISQPRILTWYWGITWHLVTPALLIFVIFFTFYYYVPAYWGDYQFPYEIQVLGWLLCCFTIVFIPVGALWGMARHKGSCISLFQSSPEFCPASVRQLMKEHESQTRFRYTHYDNESFVTTEDKANGKRNPLDSNHMHDSLQMSNNEM